MAIVAGNKARTLDCDAFLALDAAHVWRLRLYTNNYTPVRTSVPADFTAPTYTGYAAQNFGVWGASAINGAGDAESVNATLNTFQPTALTALPQTVYGYWVDDGGTNFLWGELFTTPFVFVDTGSILQLTPKFQVGVKV